MMRIPVSSYCFLPLIAAILLSAPFATYSPVLRFLSLPSLSDLGDYSFHLYAFQIPVGVAYRGYLHGSIGSPQVFGSYFLVLAVFCFGFVRLVDQPLMTAAKPYIASWTQKPVTHKVDIETPVMPIKSSPQLEIKRTGISPQLHSIFRGVWFGNSCSMSLPPSVLRPFRTVVY